MQVSVETTSELQRKMTVHVPEEKIQEQVASRLKSLAGKVKIHGFRPGKVPHSLIEKRFGSSVREEVLADMIQSSFYDAVRAEKLNPVGGPVITSQESAHGQGLSYVADFEVMPEFVLIPPETMEVKRYVSEVTEQDVDGMILRLREQKKIWREVDRPAAVQDRVTISFEGKLGDEPFTDGKTENFPVVLGSNQLIPGFEDKLVGAAPHSHLTFDLEFPQDYGNEKLAGKSGTFDVDIAKVEESVLPELDAEFAKSYGIESGDMDSFRADIRANMEREMNRALQARTKTSVMDELFERNSSLSVPRALVNQELTHLIMPYQEAGQKRKQSFDEAQLKERFEPIAKRRVTLGLLLNKIIQTNKLSVDPKRVRAAVEELAVSYENPEQVVSWYYSNRAQLEQVESMVLEDQVVDAVLEKAKVIDEKISFKDLMQPVQEANV
jgi:trigger factor